MNVMIIFCRARSLVLGMAVCQLLMSAGRQQHMCENNECWPGVPLEIAIRCECRRVSSYQILRPSRLGRSASNNHVRHTRY